MTATRAAASVALADLGVEPLDVRAVLTHHWLVRRRGGEKVLAALCGLLPGAPIYTLVYDPRGAGDGWPRVHASWLQHVPGARHHYPKLLPLIPGAARSIQLPPAELVLCSDAALAKAMRPHEESKVICYCHSPMRYVWEPELSAAYRATLPAWLRPMWPGLVERLRVADSEAARRVDAFVANSHTVAQRIRRAYGRESTVVYPPVDVPPEPLHGNREEFLLCIGHHVAYKRLDLAIDACRQLRRRLVVIGEGPGVRRIGRRDELVTSIGWQPDEVVADHYRRAAALLFPGEEDFGIVPVEAMGHGCPVIAYGAGGATESVIDGVTGVLFAQQSVESLAGAIERCGQLEFDPVVMHARAWQFSKTPFLSHMRGTITRVLSESRVGGNALLSSRN